MHFTRPSAGAAGARRGPVPLSHGSGADSHSLPLRPAGRLREAPGSGRRLPKAGPGFTTSKDDARRDELLMLASTPYRSRFLQMEFYSLYLKNCMFVTNKKVCGKVNEKPTRPRSRSFFFFEGVGGRCGGLLIAVGSPPNCCEVPGAGGSTSRATSSPSWALGAAQPLVGGPPEAWGQLGWAAGGGTACSWRAQVREIAPVEGGGGQQGFGAKLGAYVWHVRVPTAVFPPLFSPPPPSSAAAHARPARGDAGAAARAAFSSAAPCGRGLI